MRRFKLDMIVHLSLCVAFRRRDRNFEATALGRWDLQAAVRSISEAEHEIDADDDARA
jgi:hypothetical protein